MQRKVKPRVEIGTEIKEERREKGRNEQSDQRGSETISGEGSRESVEKMAERQGTKIKSYKIIYQMIEDVQRMIRGQLEPVYEEKVLGHAEVRQIITIPKIGSIAGSYVTDGLVRRGAKARLFRSGKEIYKGNVAQLKRFKDDVREVGTGFECGINLQNYDTMQQGDVIEIYDMVEVTV